MKAFFYTLLLFHFISLSVNAQHQITGIVKDDQGLPVLAATVLEKGTNNYAITDEGGQFTISPRKALPTTLEVNMVGFKIASISVTSLNSEPLVVSLKPDNVLAEVIVTSRRRAESAQNVPIPISIVGGDIIEESGAFNVNRIKEMVPTVQLYSSNPRNTTLNIRGLGSTFGLTNDGIDPGVGFYVDGVYIARPAATTLDFIDVEQIEVLRGPQGTLFGKNTTAGAFNITTRPASFTPEANLEVSYGNLGFIQAKSSLTGPLIKDKLAARLSFSGTQRNGTLYNVSREEYVNDLNNLGVRGQFLYALSDNFKITLSGDFSKQNPNGFAQVVAGVTPTLRPEFRQFNNIIADFNYALPSTNPFDRLIDHDTPWRSKNELGGFALNAEAKIGGGTLTSTSAWRYWNWGPSNDRDFTGLPVLSLSQAPSKHEQWSQEFRYAGDLSNRLSGVVGAYFLGQNLSSNPYHTEESGWAQWRFSQNNQNALWQTPGLLDGYGTRTTNSLESFSSALFANVDWEITKNLHLLPGIRFNHDTKSVDFLREVYGGLQTEDPELIALQRRIYNGQAFSASVKDNNFSGQITLNYKSSDRFNSFATLSSSYKPVGLNLGGLPTENGQPMLELAQVKPEYVTHWEIGVKTKPSNNSTLNLVYHHTGVQDYQTLVQTPELGVNRGYLANAEKVRVSGLELDGNIRVNKHFNFFGAFAFTDAIYVKFVNAPVPLEEVGGEAYKDISGGVLPGISRYAGSLGGEITSGYSQFLGQEGKFFLGFDTFYRSSFSSSPSPSAYMNIDSYVLANARIGFRATQGTTISIWGRNIFDVDYFEQLLAASGGAGHYAAVLGDPRTYGITLRHNFLLENPKK